MAFRYINPGYAELLNGTGMTTTESFIYNPRNGVAFATDNSNNFVELLPAGYVSKEVHCKFDLYVVGDPYYGDSFSMGLAHYKYPNTKDYIFGIQTHDGYAYVYNDSRLKNTTQKLKSDALNSICFSLNLQEATASLNLNDETITVENLTNMQNFGALSPFKVSLPRATGCTYYVSNLIISDEEISPKERVIALPTSATATDMTAGTDGIYIANAANQTLLQTPDVAALIEEYGANSAVTGISVVGNPAYRTGTGITTLTGLSKAGGVISEHNSCALSEETLGTAMSGWTLQNTTIADLQNMQFGWKAGE